MAKLPLNISDSPVEITKLVPGGQGIGTVSKNSAASAIITAGKKGFFWNALPGETVTEYTVTKNKSHYFEAIALKIENKNPHRIAPKDSCYLSTSPWQIMDYDYELTLKAELLIETFRQSGLDQCFEGCLSRRGSIKGPTPATAGWRPDAREILVKTDCHDLFYRNKMEYALYWDIEAAKIKLAFHQRGSHRKIPIETSSIERPEIFKKATEIVNELNEKHEEARKYQSLLLRCGQDGNIAGGLFENKKPHPKFKNLEDEICGQKYSYSPNGFFQINLPVYELALKEIAKYIDSENVLDLYAGVGTIGLSVARDKNLTLVESNKDAFTELSRNCEVATSEGCLSRRGSIKGPTPATAGWRPDARRSRLRAVSAKSEDALNLITPDQTVIVDPPRAGCDQKLLDKFLDVTPKRIIYLSCNPATQARDLKILTKKYKIISVQPFNFFPRTPHLENLVVLDVL